MPADPESMPPATPGAKRRTLALLIGVCVLLFVLSIGITGMPLLPGELFALDLPTPGRPAGGAWPGSEVIMLIVRILLALAILLFPINVLLVIFTREGRRRLLTHLLTLVVLWLSLSAASRIAQNLAEDQATREGEGGVATTLPPLPPLPDFVPNPSLWTVLAVTLAISALLVGLAAGVIWLIWRNRPRPEEPLARIGLQAQAALDALQFGDDFRATIIRCYREMTRVLQQERGIQRGIAMTPAEFESVLQGKGLPSEAVHQLTQVFEDVRYGDLTADRQQERLAKDSLAAIVAACRSAQGAG